MENIDEIKISNAINDGNYREACFRLLNVIESEKKKQKELNQNLLKRVSELEERLKKIEEEGDRRMKKFKFHWLGGKVEEAEGFDVANAFRRLGYSAGAMRALDYFEEIEK